MAKYEFPSDKAGQRVPGEDVRQIEIDSAGEIFSPDGESYLAVLLRCGCRRPECPGTPMGPLILDRAQAAEAIVILRAAAAAIWPGFVADLDQEETTLNNSREA